MTILWWALNPDWKSSISWLCWGLLLLSLCLCFPSVPCLSPSVCCLCRVGVVDPVPCPDPVDACSHTCISSAHLPVLHLVQVDSPMCCHFLLPLVVVILLCQLFNIRPCMLVGFSDSRFYSDHLYFPHVQPWLPHPALIVLFNPLEDFLPGQIHLVWFLLAVKTL